jgi:hypothetical protein
MPLYTYVMTYAGQTKILQTRRSNYTGWIVQVVGEAFWGRRACGRLPAWPRSARHIRPAAHIHQRINILAPIDRSLCSTYSVLQAALLGRHPFEKDHQPLVNSRARAELFTPALFTIRRIAWSGTAVRLG